MSQNRKDGETDADILRVLKSSGYPLEQEIASILEKMGWKFTLNYAFTDVETNKSREIDVLADRVLWDERYYTFSDLANVIFLVTFSKL
jgi:hypothetical protein